MKVTLNYYTKSSDAEFWDLYEKRDDGSWWREVTSRIDDEIKYHQEPMEAFVTKFTELCKGLEKVTIELEHEYGSGDYSCEYYLAIRGWRLATEREVAEVMVVLEQQSRLERSHKEDEIAKAKALLKAEGLL